MTEKNCQNCKHSIVKTCQKGGGKIVQNLYCKLFKAGKDALMLASTARTKHPSAGDAARCGKAGRLFEQKKEGEEIGINAALTLVSKATKKQTVSMASLADKHSGASPGAFKPYTVKVDGVWGSTAKGDRL